MSRPRPHAIALVLLAILLVAALPQATASSPQASAWTPFDMGHRITAMALARDGSGLIVGANVPASDPANGTAQPRDPSFFSLTNGLMGQAAYSASSGPNIATGVVAASPDGTFFARATTQGDPTGNAVNLEVFNASDLPNTDWTAALPNDITGLAIADHGARVVAVTAGANDTHGAMEVFDSSGKSLGVDHLAGGLHSVAISDDGRYVVAGGVTATGDGLRGFVALFDLTQGVSPVYSDTLGTSPQGRVLAVAMDPQGTSFVAGSADGSLASFHNAGASTVSAQVLDLGNRTVASVAMNATGGTVVAGDYGGVHLLQRAPFGLLQLAWSHNTTAPVAQVALSSEGDVAAAAVGGSSGAVLGFARSTATPIWTLPGNVDRVALTGDASSLVAAHGRFLRTYTLPRAFTVGFPDGANITATGATTNVAAYRTATTTVALRNDGAVPLSIHLGFSYTGDWSLVAQPGVVHLLPGQQTTLHVDATPGSVTAGGHTVTLTARTVGSSVRQDLALHYDVLPSQGLLITPLDSSPNRTLTQGDSTRELFHLSNLGNQPVNLSLQVSQSVDLGGPWTASLESHPRSLGPGAATTLALDIQVPSDTPNGARNTVTLAVSGGGVVTSSAVHLVVNPVDKLGAAVDTSARYVNATIPGRYNVTVTNEGNVPVTARLVYNTQTDGAPGWTIAVPVEPFTLDRGASQTLPVTLYPPNSATPGDHVYVTITAMPNVASTKLLVPGYANVTLGAVFHVFQTPPKSSSKVPGPGVPGAIAGLAAALLLVRRRGLL